MGLRDSLLHFVIQRQTGGHMYRDRERGSSMKYRIVNNYIDNDLSYGEILAGRPGAWLVKQICFICMQSKKSKGTHVEIQIDFQNMF